MYLSPISSMRPITEQQKGFTLVELIVSIAIFSIVMLVAIGSLLTLVDANRKAQTLSLVMNNLDLALDRLFREIATGQNYHCIETPSDIGGEGYDLPTGTEDCSAGSTSGGPGIVLTNDRGYRVQYEVFAGQIWRNLEGGGWTPVTAQEVVIEEMIFYVEGTDAADSVQPQVSIIVKGFADAPRISNSRFDVQTRVVQRLLDN